MARAWKTYTRLVDALVAEAGGPPLRVDPAVPDPREDVLLRALGLRLGKRQHDPQAAALLDQLGIRPSYVRQHLRYVATMTPLQRQQLAGGAALSLIEETKAALLADLNGAQLSGSLSEQRRQLREALHHRATTEQALTQIGGWLQPRQGEDGATQRLTPIWLYDAVQRNADTALDPAVARALLQTCLAGATDGAHVIDPMAGSGVIGLEAVRLGHFAWLSDLHPGDKAWIHQHDLLAGTDETNGLDRKVGPEVADLLVLHPPVRAELNRTEGDLESFIEDILDRTVPTVKEDGRVALIVSVSEGPDALQHLANCLTAVVGRERAQQTANQRASRGLESHHLAVAKDGREGWHVLIAKKERLT